jgi:hypothetical protein
LLAAWCVVAENPAEDTAKVVISPRRVANFIAIIVHPLVLDQAPRCSGAVELLFMQYRSASTREAGLVREISRRPIGIPPSPRDLEPVIHPWRGRSEGMNRDIVNTSAITENDQFLIFQPLLRTA